MVNIIRNSLLLLAFMCSIKGFGQNEKGENSVIAHLKSDNKDRLPGYLVGYDTGYVTSFRDNFIITILNESKFSRINASYFVSDQKGYFLNYKTNSLNTWGIGLDYKWLTFEYSTKMPWYTPDPTYGPVENKGFGFGLTMRRFSFRYFYEIYKGYYLENTEQWVANGGSAKDAYYIRPDIYTRMNYLKMNYVFNNKRFSNNASMWQLERQEKAAGSFVAGLSLIYNEFRADSSIIPYGLDTFPNANNTFFAMSSIGANIGYVANIPFGKKKKWFITAALIPGVSYQFGKLEIDDVGGLKSNALLGFQSEFRFGICYNGDLWYLGSMARSYQNLNNLLGDAPFAINNTFGRIYFGYRLPSIKHNNKLLKKYGL
jgi:hypothetical protein